MSIAQFLRYACFKKIDTDRQINRPTDPHSKQFIPTSVTCNIHSEILKSDHLRFHSAKVNTTHGSANLRYILNSEIKKKIYSPVQSDTFYYVFSTDISMEKNIKVFQQSVVFSPYCICCTLLNDPIHVSDSNAIYKIWRIKEIDLQY